MIDTTMVVLFFQGRDVAARVRKVKEVAAPLATAGYEADFDGIPSVHAHDEHGHFNDWGPETEPKP
jgi:hypothetical protein